MHRAGARRERGATAGVAPRDGATTTDDTTVPRRPVRPLEGGPAGAGVGLARPAGPAGARLLGHDRRPLAELVADVALELALRLVLHEPEEGLAVVGHLQRTALGRR